jgi:hypothetical protein
MNIATWKFDVRPQAHWVCLTEPIFGCNSAQPWKQVRKTTRMCQDQGSLCHCFSPLNRSTIDPKFMLRRKLYRHQRYPAKNIYICFRYVHKILLHKVLDKKHAIHHHSSVGLCSFCWPSKLNGGECHHLCCWDQVKLLRFLLVHMFIQFRSDPLCSLSSESPKLGCLLPGPHGCPGHGPVGVSKLGLQ